MVKYLEILIDNKPVDLSSIEELPLMISYKLEDRNNFQTKQGSSVLSLSFPATNKNGEVANTYHNPGIEDLTIEHRLRGIRNSKIRINSQEILTGKAFLKEAVHTDRPVRFEYDFYGNNSDWLIDLKDLTFYDILKHITFVFSKSGIIDSWSFNGTLESIPYVFAPVRYGQTMETFIHPDTNLPIEDYNMIPVYMKPALSKYWIIYWAFKTIGYKINSDFFDLPYFRRQVMPWTWGSFLDSDGTRLDVLKFLAKSTGSVSYNNMDITTFANVLATNDFLNGGYDNSDSYQYVGTDTMQWSYLTAPAFNFGLLEANFHLAVFVNAKASANSAVELRVQWFKNGIRVINGSDNGNGTELVNLKAPVVGSRSYYGIAEDFLKINVNQGDVVTAKLYVHTFDSGFGKSLLTLSVEEFTLEYFKTPLGGTINFENFLALKNYKFLDFLGGVVDEFDLTVQTNSSVKAVYFEPTHKYSLLHNQSVKSGGYFNGNSLDWTFKQDLSKESVLEPFTDSERELLFNYKDDSNDGTLKKVQDRNNVLVGQAKYVFPERFMVGQRKIENRFFSPTMHYDVKQWTFAGFEEPQMVIMAPENISNLSKGEAQNTFQPKSCYYKGLTSDHKWVFDSDTNYMYPYMFAVNYKPGGENDPVLSYCDEVIGDEKGVGLLRRFFYQRLAILDNGQYYKTWFKLSSNDVANFLHREFIICRNQKWELVQLDYRPLKEESSQCILKKWSPIING